MVLLQRLVLYCGIGKLVCEIATLLRYRTNLGQSMLTYLHTHTCDGADWLVKQLFLHCSTVVHHIDRERERVCVYFTEVKRKEANQPPLSRFSRAVSVSNYIFGRLLKYIYTIGTYVKGSCRMKWLLNPA